MRNLILICLALPLTAGAQPAASKDALPPAETILDHYVEVTGGVAAYQKRHSVIEKGTIEIEGRGVNGTITNYTAEPDKAYSVIDLEGVGKMEEGSDGKVAWERSALEGPRVKDGQEKAQSLEEGIFNSPIHWRDIYTKVETTGSETVNGEDCWKVVATPKSGNPETIYFSKKTGFEVKHSAVQATQMGDIAADSYLSNYRSNGGVLEPETLRQSFAGQTMVIHINDTQVNAEIPPSRFEPPEEIQQLLKKTAAPAGPVAGGGEKLNVYMGGEPMASETYSFSDADGKYTWSGSGQAHMGPMELDIQLYKIVTDRNYHPLEAELRSKMGQITREVKTTFAGGQAHNQITTPNGPQTKDDAVSPDAVILAFPLPVFPLSVLARRVRFDTTEPQVFHAYLLAQREVPVTVQYTGKEKVEFADKTVELRHVTGSVELHPGQPMTVDLWENEDHEIVKVSAPAHHIEVYREGYAPKPAPPPPPAAPSPEPK